MAHIRVSVNHLRRGMVLAEDVYTNTGVVIVAQGAAVTKEVVSMLTRHFIEQVSVEYQPNAAAELEKKEEPIVNPKQYEEFQKNFSVAENKLSDNLKDIVYNSKDVNVSVLMDMTNEILAKSSNETSLCNMLLMMKKNTESIYAHSINVSILCQILAKWINCTKQEIENAAVAGLLHDIGTLKFPKEMLDNYSFRKEIAGGIYDKHVIYGYDLIKNQNIDDDIKSAVLTHHERMDGSGFPLKVGREKLGKIAKLLTIADLYDTYTMKEEGVMPMSVFTVINKK